MNLEQATALREKFYAGTSTVSEERRLLDFLRSESCPPAWQADRAVLETLVALPETGCSSPPLGWKRVSLPVWRNTQRPESTTTSCGEGWGRWPALPLR